jgi:hypothetical protein
MDFITVVDLSMTDVTSRLTQLILFFVQMLEEISGITKERIGDSPASQTLGATKISIANSQLVTTVIRLMYEAHKEKELLTFLKLKRLAMVYFNDKEDEIIIGNDGMAVMVNTIDFLTEELGVYIGDGDKEDKIKDMIEKLISGDVNSGKNTTAGFLRAAMEESLAGVADMLEKKEKELQAIADKQRTHEKEMEQMRQQGADHVLDKKSDNKVGEIYAAADAKAGVNVVKAKTDYLAMSKAHELEQEAKAAEQQKGVPPGKGL